MKNIPIHIPRLAFVLSTFIILFASCTGEKPDFQANSLTRVHTELNYLKDEYGRYVYLHGVNVSGSNKFPANEDPTSFATSGSPSYTGKPFPLDEADRHFSQLRELGFNVIRLIVSWEGIQPDSPDQYDENYLDYLQQIVASANEHHIYVLLDMHQDLFSRHLISRFNGEFSNNPLIRATLESMGMNPDGPEAMVLALMPPYTDAVRGDGAPRWAVEAIMPEKNFDSQFWGYPRLLGRLDEDSLNTLNRLISDFSGMDIEIPPGILSLLQPHGPYDISETSDLLPFTFWGINVMVSLDVQRSFAAFFAGRDAYPTLTVAGKNIQDYLQDAFTNAWREVARRVKDYPNVIGYDIINEPLGAFMTLSAAAALLETGSRASIESLLAIFFSDPQLAQDITDLLIDLQLIPPDNSPETRQLWGFEHASLMGLMNLNYGFEPNYFQPFYEKVGGAILEIDPRAVIWIEPSLGLEAAFAFAGMGSGLGFWEMNMTVPEGIPQAVFTSHWYPDIYPFFGFNVSPREYTPEEHRFRDYRDSLASMAGKASHSLGNIPVVIGEFGTYFNFNGIENSIEDDYAVSKEILDNYYEAYEELLLGHIQWCWSSENTYERGDGWNSEDFSVIDPEWNPRGEEAYSRPTPTFISGKPVSSHFYSPLHYFDPQKGKANPEREFELVFESRETSAPTEIFLPYELHYPEGFYVWITDGHVIYDPERSTLFYYPIADEPGFTHRITIRPPIPEEGLEHRDWQYFFREDSVISRGGSSGTGHTER